jgi:hypothetical protein
MATIATCPVGHPLPPRWEVYCKDCGKKRCRKCGEWLPVNQFNPDNSKKESQAFRHCTCRACRKT